MKAARPHKHLILVGGGHSHVTVIKRFAMQPVPGLKVTLVTPSLKTPYSGMLPGCVAGHYSVDEIYIDLAKLCFKANVDWILTEASGLDPERQLLKLSGRPDLQYDYLSLDVGITPDLGDLKVGANQVTPVKPIASFLGRLTQLQQQLTPAQRIVVVGGGAASIELVMALAERSKEKRSSSSQDSQLHLVSSEEVLLKEAPTGTRRIIEQTLVGYGVSVTTNARITQYVDGVLTTDQGDEIRADHVLWATGASPLPWLHRSGLECDEKGYVSVGETLQSVSHANIFAVGDTAHMVASPRPKAGVYAVRQGPWLARNLRAIALGESLKPFKPQSRHLALIALGEQKAVGYRNGLSVSGRWVWRLKDWIDRRFLAQFNDWMPPWMADHDGSRDPMRCLGCGSKVPALRLQETLHERNAELTHDDAQVLMTGEDTIWLQTIDQIRPLVPDLYLLSRIGLNHSVSDIYAMGGAVSQVLSNLTIEEAEGRVADNFFSQITAGAFDQASILKAPIRGGHSSEGPESQVGFAVTGQVQKHCLRSKRGVKEGDRLILTKALGIGVIFASLMQGRSKPDWLEAAIDSMLRSNRHVAELTAHVPVSAMTDVTGFGLAGHLGEMVRGEQLAARLYLNDLPSLPGALNLFSETAIESSLAIHNEAAVEDLLVVDHSSLSQDARYRLLFDPQTSGGLLVSLPEQAVETFLSQLSSIGEIEARCIGDIVEGRGIQVCADRKSLR